MDEKIILLLQELLAGQYGKEVTVCIGESQMQ